MKLSRFWQALEELPACADTLYDWRQLLGEELAATEQLLRRTGRVASVLSCPAPGGDHCPRRIVRQSDGSHVAVCGNRPKECGPIDITHDDVAIFELDARGLADQLGRGLGFRPEFRPADGLHRTWQIGHADIAAGCSFPVYLTIPTGDHDLVPVVSKLSRLANGPFGVLAPTRRYFSADAVDVLSRNASDAAALEELIDVLPSDELACAAPTQAIFPRAWAGILPAGESAKRAWMLSPDAKWENLVFEFEAEEMLRVTFRQETRSFEPIDLGMRDHRDKRPTDQWALLKILAVCNGVLDYTPEVRTQKKFLSDKLRSSFGISEDPIRYDRRSNQYHARFIIRGAVLHDLSKRCQFA